MVAFGGNGPIDYSGMIQGPDLTNTVAQGFQLGAGIRELHERQVDKAAERSLARQYQDDINTYMAQPTAQGAAALALKYPKQREAFQQAWGQVDEAQRKEESKALGQAYSAALSGRPDLVQSMLQDRIVARKNSGMSTADEEGLLELAKNNPQGLTGMLGFMLSHTTDPKSFATTYSTLGAEQRAQQNAPLDLRKRTADAITAEAQAGNEPTKLGLANVETQEKIITARSDRDISALDMQIKQADSQTKREELQLKRDEMVAKRDEKLKEQGLAAQNGLEGVQLRIQTLENLVNHPGLSKGTGMGGDVAAWFNGTDAADFRAGLETVKSQQFLGTAEQMKGQGAISDADAARYETARASVNPRQSPAAMRNALGVMLAIEKRGMQKLIAEGKLPTSGGAFIAKVPGAGNVTQGDVNLALKMYPGSTPEQFMQFLEAKNRAK